MTQTKSLYRKLVPKFIRQPIDRNKLKRTILDYYDGIKAFEVNAELNDALDYLRKNKLTVFPYRFVENYRRKDVDVFKDESTGLKYVLLEGKKLYFKRKSSSRGIRRNYTNLLLEQDKYSPHRYIVDDFDIIEGDILVDVGAAEGILPLSVIEKVKKVYLFETDKNWIEALQATFEPWKEKVVIVNKFVSNFNDDRHVALDHYFSDKESYTFLKIDAEGSDGEVLDGCKKGLKNENSLKVAVCCYHKPNDDKEFSSIIQDVNFKITFSNGYMIYFEGPDFNPPYLRKGVLRAVKS